MQTNNTHYQLPDTTDASMRRLAMALVVFFTTLMIVVALLIYFAQQIVQHIPFSAEQRFVRPYENLISRFFSDQAGDPEVTQYLQELSDTLQAVMLLPEDIDVTVHFVDVDEVNAFATLGGHLFVFSGLLEILPDENSLAMILAHEIAHIQHRDPIAAMGRGMALQLLFNFITGGGGNAEELINAGGLATFNREQERKADIAALHALNTHYSHVGGYRTFFEFVDELEQEDLDIHREQQTMPRSDAFNDWISSHPPTTERLRYLDHEMRVISSVTGVNRPLPTVVQQYFGE